MLSRILLFVVILALPLNFSVRTLEIPSAPPLVNASCMWLSLKPEAAIFSAIPFDTAFELMSGCRVLRFCFFWPRNTVYVSTHDAVKLCCNRVLSAAIFSAIPFDTAFELMSGCRVLRFCFFWPRNTVYVSTHDAVKLCCNRVLSVIYILGCQPL